MAASKANKPNTDAWTKPLPDQANLPAPGKPNPWTAPLGQPSPEEAQRAKKARRAVREIMFEDEPGTPRRSK